MLNFRSILINVPITLIALTGHELAHAWVSSKQGDPTPKMEGRLTLNPLAHLDLYGTILMILTGFGWAKPVAVNPMYYKDRKKGMALTAIAGPIANLIMAFLGILIAVLLLVVGSNFGWSANVVYFIKYIAYIFAFRNLCFMVFNLIPIPPFDGSRVLGLFVPNRVYYNMLQYERYSMLIIIVLSLTGAFDIIIGSGVNVFYNLIVKTVSGIVSLIV
ncbi:MAG: site-2 protease family protein [Firmicutes bacterium]|nr:site-2 protease family protein [Bacillota bacterium]